MLKEAKRIPEEILGKVSIAVSCFVSPYVLSHPEVGQEVMVDGSREADPRAHSIAPTPGVALFGGRFLGQ